MKNYILIGLLFMGFTVLGQSNHLLGLKMTPFNHSLTTDNDIRSMYNGVKYGLEYNYIISNQHSIAIGLSAYYRRSEREGQYIDSLTHHVLDGIFKTRNFDFAVPMYYLFHHNQWLVRAGFNHQIFNAIFKSYRNEELVADYTFDNSYYNYVLEYHLGIGRDFDFGRFKARVNAFINGPITKGSYLQYGLDVGLFYQL